MKANQWKASQARRNRAHRPTLTRRQPRFKRVGVIRAIVGLRPSAEVALPCASFNLTKQLWGELVQIVTPIDPGVRSLALFVDDVELVFLEHLDRRTRGFD